MYIERCSFCAIILHYTMTLDFGINKCTTNGPKQRTDGLLTTNTNENNELGLGEGNGKVNAMFLKFHYRTNRSKGHIESICVALDLTSNRQNIEFGY